MSVVGGPERAVGQRDVVVGAGFEAVFLDPVGRMVQQRWAVAAVAVAFEELDPVSAFPVVPGRRWGPGLWWSATTGRHVASGSNAMRAQLMVLDRDPRVLGIAGRPVRVLWRDGRGRGRVRSWVPRLFARYKDGTGMLADCPSHPEAGGERASEAAAVMTEACAQVGLVYRRLEPLDRVMAANLKWLAGYRHPRNCGRRGLMAAVLGAFTEARPLIEGVEAVGDPIEVLPAAFHALWHGQLAVALDVPLHERVLVHSPTVLAGTGSAADRRGSAVQGRDAVHGRGVGHEGGGGARGQAVNGGANQCEGAAAGGSGRDGEAV
ncbi:TnsA-like heteromeric transposase endonuclease subunit [Streptomyces sp. NPDC014744]|uniref:TnsA-like heteromeric transposase endonuclease subunit n=1 Tax=Streptomyces sp. NPDC014744 TaxID=3364903 RepID=UPI0036FEA3D3